MKRKQNETTPTMRAPLPHEAARPFDYAHPTVAELSATIGGPWVIARNTPAMREKYPVSKLLTPKQYKNAERCAIEARSWARPADIVIRNLIIKTAAIAAARINMRPVRSDDLAIVCTLPYMGRDALEDYPEVIAARALLAQSMSDTR